MMSRSEGSYTINVGKTVYWVSWDWRVPRLHCGKIVKECKTTFVLDCNKTKRKDQVSFDFAVVFHTFSHALLTLNEEMQQSEEEARSLHPPGWLLPR
jgi:hypothetical protein